MNLNDLIRAQTEWTFKYYPISVELILSEANFPELDGKVYTGYRYAFAQLYGEVIDARPVPSKMRVTSSFQENLQTVTIDHNSVQIDGITLVRLNRELEGCFRGQVLYQGRPHGNHLAANLLHEYGGKISISNITDGDYNVRTKVEIPIPQSNTPPNP